MCLLLPLYGVAEAHERIEVGKMLPELYSSYIREMVPDEDGGSAAMCLPEVESSCQPMSVCPPGPASLVTGNRPYEYAVHVEEMPLASISITEGGASTRVGLPGIVKGYQPRNLRRDARLPTAWLVWLRPRPGPIPQPEASISRPAWPIAGDVFRHGQASAQHGFEDDLEEGWA